MNMENEALKLIKEIFKPTHFETIKLPANTGDMIMSKKNEPRYELNTVTDFKSLHDADYKSMEFVKPGLVRGTVGSLVAAGGVGKSYKALQEAVLIASGHSKSIKKGGVLYLPAEDPIDEIGKRLQAIAKAYKLTEQEKAEAAENLKIWPLLGASPDLLEKTEDSQPLIDAICNIAKTYKNPLRIIYFDTLRRFSYADENDGGQMSKVLACMETICKRINCSCFFLHHASKAAALNGNMAMQQAARGSSVLTDNIRYQEYLAPMTDNEAEKLGEVINSRVPSAVGGEKSFFIKWGVSKQNYGYPIGERWFKRNRDGVLMPVELDYVEKYEKGNGRRDDGY